ncbi:hypothetical protein [Xanthomonas cannabis]|uniref:hypothetical protein n=1 Tax=Xanthomonas cannabis TaxID=1885674 RepID=UPI0033B27276
MPKLERDEVVDERWKRRLIWQLPVFTKEIGFCESFSHVCRLSPIRTTEDRAHAEIDRARQESKQAKQQLATSRREAALTERQLDEALDRAQGNVSELRQDLTIQQARADVLEAQLAKLNDLPAALEAAWQQHVGRSQPKHPEPVRSKRSRGKAAP